MLQQLGQHIAAAKERARLCGERKKTVQAIDKWIEGCPEPKPSRPEAIRKLVELGLKAKGKR